MNYLAHAFLAGEDAERSLGSLVADWLRRTGPATWPPAMVEGIALHRAVDGFVDHHPAFRRSVSRLPAGHRHLRPVLVDVFYDHFLSRHWASFASQDLRDYLDERYQAWRPLLPVLPPEMAAGLERMMAEDWLGAYGELAGVAAAFERMRWRLRRPELVAGAVGALEGAYGGLEGDFLEVWAGVVGFVGGHEG